MTATHGWVGDVLAARRAGRPVALLFDYDGTLAPIAPHPSLALLPGLVRSLLAELARATDVWVAVISGRALADVRAMVATDGLFLAGCAGAEMDLRGARVSEPVSADARACLDAAAADLATHQFVLPGVWVEPKPLGFAVHYRAADGPTARRLHALVAPWAERFPELRVLDVCMALEVGLRGGWDKGSAVRRILRELPPGALPAYFGDSENDRPGMEAAAAAGGVTVAVGPEAPDGAKYWLTGPARLHVDLEALVRALDGPAGPLPGHPAGASCAPREA